MFFSVLSKVLLIPVHNINLALAFVSNDWAISLKDQVWSNVSPKYFTDAEDLIVDLSYNRLSQYWDYTWFSKWVINV